MEEALDFGLRSLALGEDFRAWCNPVLPACVGSHEPVPRGGEKAPRGLDRERAELRAR